MPSAEMFESSALVQMQRVVNVYYDVAERFGVDSTNALIAQTVTRKDMLDLDRRLHTEAALIGAHGALSADERSLLEDIISTDQVYMNGFMDVLPKLSRAQALNRCNAYVATLRSTINEMAAFNLPTLPMYPQDDRLDCGHYCKCHLVIRRLGTKNWDIYWDMDITAEHCDDCLRLSQEWKPLQIRGGRVLGAEKMSDKQLLHIKSLLVLAGVA